MYILQSSSHTCSGELGLLGGRFWGSNDSTSSRGFGVWKPNGLLDGGLVLLQLDRNGKLKQNSLLGCGLLGLYYLVMIGL